LPGVERKGIRIMTDIQVVQLELTEQELDELVTLMGGSGEYAHTSTHLAETHGNFHPSVSLRDKVARAFEELA
jgi:hypothetical protein